jgi:hypothetical protein
VVSVTFTDPVRDGQAPHALRFLWMPAGALAKTWFPFTNSHSGEEQVTKLREEDPEAVPSGREGRKGGLYVRPMKETKDRRSDDCGNWRPERLAASRFRAGI